MSIVYHLSKGYRFIADSMFLTFTVGFLIHQWLHVILCEIISYRFTSEELEAFIGVKKALDSSYRLFSPSFKKRTSFSEEAVQSEPTRPRGRHLSSGNTIADCVEHDHYTFDKKRYRFTWHSATCHVPGQSPDFDLTCNSTYILVSTYRHETRQPLIFKGRQFIWWQFCPPNKVCIDDDLSGDERRNIRCADQDEITTKEHAAVAFKGAGSSANPSTDPFEPDWCALGEIVPGLQYPATPQMTTFMLTEEVSWANGSYYNAPKLLIRDSAKLYKNGFDRAYKTNTNLVSTLLNVGSVRGRLQSRAVDFCMDIIRGGDVWTVMMFTWFKYSARRGKIPETLENVQYEDEEDAE